MKHGNHGNAWAIVLAAGEGTRLAPVTRALYGHDLPKQFAALAGDRTFLQMTMDRIAPLVPPERTIVVVSEERLPLAQEQLDAYAGVQIVAQPRNLGTAVGVLLPLAHVLARDPAARVLIFPSDHHFRREGSFVEAVRRALLAAEGAPSGVALVGAPAESAATDLGWIVPERAMGPSEARARHVSRFVEKPPESMAMQLLAAGALWNTLVVAARGESLWRLVRRRIPVAAAGFERYRAAVGNPAAPLLMRYLYDRLPPADLSRDVLERAQGLAVVAAVDAGWSDCGTPERLFECLQQSGEAGALRERIERRRFSLAEEGAHVAA